MYILPLLWEVPSVVHYRPLLWAYRPVRVHAMHHRRRQCVRNSPSVPHVSFYASTLHVSGHAERCAPEVLPEEQSQPLVPPEKYRQVLAGVQS